MTEVNTCPSCTDATVTTECTVDSAIAKSPSALTVFHSFGIDTCCGGRSTIGEAAERARISPAVLIDALEGAAKPDAVIAAPIKSSGCSCGCAGH